MYRSKHQVAYNHQHHTKTAAQYFPFGHVCQKTAHLCADDTARGEISHNFKVNSTIVVVGDCTRKCSDCPHSKARAKNHMCGHTLLHVCHIQQP